MTSPEGHDQADRRILVVAPQPFYSDRGTPIAVRQVLEALSQLGYGTDVLTLPVGRPVAIPGVRVLRCHNPFGIRSVPIGFSARKLLLHLTLVPALWARIRAGGYACVHAVEEAAFPAILLGRRYGIPVIYDMQSSLPEQLAQHPLLRGRLAQRLFERCERWLLRQADCVVASAGLARRVREQAPTAAFREWRYASPIELVSPEEVVALRHALRIPRGARVVLYSGTFEPYQGLPALLDAVGRVRASVPGAVFVLVGADEASAAGLRAQWAGTVEEAGLMILERQPREALPRFLAMADVLVSPRAYGDNLPLKVFDYLAAGRPIVATDIPTHRSVLSEERALLVPVESGALAEGIVALLRDPERAGRLAAAGRLYAERHLGWRLFVDSVAELYGEVRAHAGHAATASA